MKHVNPRPFYRWGIFWYVLVLLCMAGWWSIRHSRTSPPKVDGWRYREDHQAHYESISLERGPCFGSCPVYKVTLYRDGRAEYKPRAHLPELGDFEGEISPQVFARISYLLQRSSFEQMEGRYRALHTDDSTCIVKATSALGTKEVSDYGNEGPIDLWTIQELVDGIRVKTDWKAVSKD